MKKLATKSLTFQKSLCNICIDYIPIADCDSLAVEDLVEKIVWNKYLIKRKGKRITLVQFVLVVVQT